MLKTYQPKAKEVIREWHLLDAKDEILGRLCTKIATYLTGKHKTTYSTHMDMGDFVVVLNAEKVEVTGRKDKQKAYRTHSGYPGGFKERSYQQVMDVHPERIIEHAVLGMLPNNRLRDPRMLRLKVVVGDKNPYEKQIAKESEIAA
jgi:large subunit ribosomal protein L13